MHEPDATALDALSLQIAEELTAEMDGKYLSFWTDGQMCGVPIADVMQIVGVQEITALPQAPEYVKGIINLRGSIIPIIDVRIRLGKPHRGYDERSCIIVSSINESLVGFAVDAVDEVSSIDPSQISPPPQIGTDESAAYLIGIATKENHVILLISTKQLLGEQDLLALSQTIKEVQSA